MRETACTPGVARLNIEHYRNKLATETHEAQRQTLTLGTILTTCWMTEDANRHRLVNRNGLRGHAGL